MSNPFLFDDDDGGDAAADAAPNPFLQDTNDASADNEPVENPFFTQPRKQSTASINPFADYGDDSAAADVVEPVAEAAASIQSPEHDSVMSFFGTTIKDEEEEHQHADAPLRPAPPTQDTKDLISTVSDHLDQTSTHLLDRIPVTRTPSPVSMRDLHSPSPTPECADLFEVEDIPTDAPAAVANENPFADIIDTPAPSVAAQVSSAVPPRPTPPRPTPPRRPSPPSPPSHQTAEVAKPTENEADLFDMFGTGVAQKPPPNVPKSNQDIINLYSAPKQTVVETKPDLLMSDIFSIDQSQVAPAALPPTAANHKPSRPPPPPSRPPAPARVPPAPPAPPETKSVDVAREVPIQTIQIVDEPAISVTPVDDRMESLSDRSSVVSSNIGVSENPSPYHSAANNSPSPVSRDEVANTYINQTELAAEVNPFGAPAVVRAPAAKQMPYFQNDDDEFDAFAAKFESVKRDESLLDGFRGGSSGYKSPLPTADGN